MKEIILDGELTMPCLLDGELSKPQLFEGEMGIYAPSWRPEEYTGQIVVSPKARSDIVLETKDKLVKGDITVTSVPFFQTENLSGGMTVYIAKE